MADGWLPRYSPNGKLLMRGSVDLSIDGELVVSDGISGAWLDSYNALYRQHSTGILHSYGTILGTSKSLDVAPTYVDARNGRYVYVVIPTPGSPSVIASDGRVWEGFGGGDSGCAVSDDGTIIILRHNDGSVWLVEPGQTNAKKIAGLGASVRACANAFVWLERGYVYGYRLATKTVENLTVDAPEFGPVPFLVGNQLWVLSYTQSRCLLRPWGSTTGIVVADGFETMYPDAVERDGMIHVAWSTPQGVPVTKPFTPISTTFLPPPPGPVVVQKSPMGTLVKDIWRFLIGPGNWVRTDGTWPMHCRVEGDSVYFIKFKDPNAWERWAKQGEFIYHVEDHSGHAGGGAETYEFSDGRWLKQDMRVGEVIACESNKLRWFRDGVWGPWEHYPYRMTLTSHKVWSDGVEEIQFTYDPGTLTDTFEVYRCRTDRGWEAWSIIDQKTNVMGGGSAWIQPCSDALLTPVSARVVWPAARPIIITVPVPPVEDPMKSREQFYDEFKKVNEFYAAEEGLQRKGGMVIDRDGVPTCDVEAMGAWGYALLGENKTPGQVKTDIARSDEWKSKHPSVEPPSFS